MPSISNNGSDPETQEILRELVVVAKDQQDSNLGFLGELQKIGWYLAQLVGLSVVTSDIDDEEDIL